MIEILAEHYRAGGIWMYPITIFQLFSFAIMIERFYFLYIKAQLNADSILKTLSERLFHGDLDGGIKYLAEQDNNPLSRILKSGLLHVAKGEEEVQAAMDESSLRELPAFDKRTGYLAMIANGATLAGLLGTVLGMIKVFAAVSAVSAAEKAQMLSAGIAEAMNCTAYGLLTALPPMIAYAFFQSRTQSLHDQVNASVASSINFILRNQNKLNLKSLA